jgi:hypothetical protein
MYYLSDWELKKLATEAEETSAVQNHMARYSSALRNALAQKKDERLKIVAEDIPAYAKYMLKDTTHTDVDINRLAKKIEENIKNMEWYNCQC